MKNYFTKYYIHFLILMIAVSSSLYAQTAAGTQIINQASVRYQYKTFAPETVKTNVVAFSVLDAPNFSISFANSEFNVFSKETVLVRIVYKNVGNQKADSAEIEGVLPSGLKFIPGSTGGVISGSTVKWKVYNIASGKTDSVRVKVRVDSTLSLGSQLTIDANISWQSSQKTSALNLFVNNFARLEFSIIPKINFVGSGRIATYQLKIKNTGNAAATNVTVTDTISALGEFYSSSLQPLNISSNKKIVQWQIPSLAGLSENNIELNVVTQPNLSHSTLVNSGTATATNDAEQHPASSSIPILPVAPKQVNASPAFKFIFGKLLEDSTLITAIVKDSLNADIPDGVPVIFTTDFGSFSNNTSSITVTTKDGKASAYLRSASVQNEKKFVTVTASAGVSQSGFASGATEVVMYPGAVTGKLINSLNNQPVVGAIAKVTDQNFVLVDADTTKADGVFFLALNKTTTLYYLHIIVADQFGDTIGVRTEIDPSQFPQKAKLIPNVIAGRLLYKHNNRPVPAENVTVFLDSVSSGSNFKSTKSLSVASSSHRVQQQKTDEQGKFKFENLKPATYKLYVDSAAFPNFSGVKFVLDTLSGTFTINVSIEIQPDSLATMSLVSLPTANAGDTLQYAVKIRNSGNLPHYNISVTDTLPMFTDFVSANKSKMKSVLFDSVSRVIRWEKDSMIVQETDSMNFTVTLKRNIPDSTIIKNTAWFSSATIGTVVNAQHAVLVRSSGELTFAHTFGDTVKTKTAGDSVTVKFRFSNIGTDTAKGILIIDTLFSNTKSKITFGKLTQTNMDVDTVVVIAVPFVAPGTSDSVTLRVRTDFTITENSKIISSAHLMWKDTSRVNVRDTLYLFENPNVSKFLRIEKTGNKKVAEIGDIVTYQITITNNSPAPIYNISIHDFIPYAFTYVKKSSRFRNKNYEPNVVTNVSTKLVWNFPDTILAGKNSQFVYQLAVGSDGMESEGLNTAVAFASAGGSQNLVSAPSSWQITVKPGVFTEKGLIIGKVFYDDNRNGYQDAGENGIKDVEIWMEDGTKITTGDNGKFSVPEVKPGEHVLRVNELSLPKGTSLIGKGRKFASDPTSQFVTVTSSGIAKANFFVKRFVIDTVKLRVKKSAYSSALRQAIPKFIYRNDTLRVSSDTVLMNVSFTYTGKKQLAAIEVREKLPNQFVIIPNTAFFNNKSVKHKIENDTVVWRLGKAPASFSGNLRYKVYVKEIPKSNTRLYTYSQVRVMTADSIWRYSKQIISENVAKDTVKNSIYTSPVNEEYFDFADNEISGDTLTISTKDMITFHTSLFVNSNRKVTTVNIIDTTDNSFYILPESIAINGTPINKQYVAIKNIAPEFTLLNASGFNAKVGKQVMRINVSDIVLNGKNEFTFNAFVNTNIQDTVITKTAALEVYNDFGENTVTISEPIYFKIVHSKPPQLSTINTYKDKLRPSRSVGKFYDLATAILDSLANNIKPFVSSYIQFDSRTNELTEQTKKFLDDVILALSTRPDVRFQINTYTYSLSAGNKKNKNIQTALARSAAVKEYLVHNGVPVANIYFRGYDLSADVNNKNQSELNYLELIPR